MLRQLRRIQDNPLEFLLGAARRYGAVVQFPVGNLPVYAINHPDGVRHVLQDNARNYSKNTIQFNTLALVTGQGLLTTSGEQWLRQRRMTQPAFHRQRIAGFGGAMTSAALRMLQRWDALPADTVLDIDHEMMKMTLEIVGHTMFSADLSDETSELVNAVLIALDYIVYRAQTPIALPLFVPTRRNRGFRRALAVLDRAVEGLINERRAATGQYDDLLAMLLEAQSEDGEPMSNRQLRNEVLTLIIAGHETVASALTWAWHLLANHPEAEARLHAELQAVLGGRAAQLHDLPQLPYTRAVFDEALRLFPPAWLITRRTVAEDLIGDTAVPAEALVIISPYVVHRQPGVWPDPEAFRPERFLAEKVEAAPRYGYIPFGGGPRMCIGNQFALMEGALVLATVAQRYRFQPLAENPVEAAALVTIRPRGGLQMQLERR